MSDTSLQVRTWIDKALHSSVWITAAQAADAAITACPDTPILTDVEATERRAAWEALEQAIGDTHTAVAPLRSRIQALRTELAGRVNTMLDPANVRAEAVRRILGGWDTQARVRREAAEAEQRKGKAEAAYQKLVKAQDGDRVDAARGSLFGGTEGPQEPQDPEVDPFATQPTEDAATAPHAPHASPGDPFAAQRGPIMPVSPAGATGKTRKKWIVEILDADKLREALIALPGGAKLQTALRVHEPTLRKLLANDMGPDMAVSAFPPGCVSVRSEDRAVRSSKAKP